MHRPRATITTRLHLWPWLLAGLSLFFLGCVDSRVLGLDRSEWLERVHSGGELPVFNRTFINYRELAKLGPGSLLYLAHHAEDYGDQALREGLLAAAVDLEAGIFRQRAAQLLERLYLDEGRYPQLLKLYAKNPAGLDPYQLALRRARAMHDKGDFREAGAAWQAILRDYPETEDRVELYLAIIEAELSQSRPGQESIDLVARLSRELATERADQRLGEAFAYLAKAGEAFLEEEELSLLRIRAATGLRDYGLAVRLYYQYVAIRNHASLPSEEQADAEGLAAEQAQALTQQPDIEMLAAYFTELPFYTASDLARSWLFSATSQGAILFRQLAARTDLDEDLAFLYRFYTGRFERSLNRNAEANAFFRQAVDLAPSALDRDASYWYLIDGLIATQPIQAIDALGAALAATDNPAYFNDLVESLSRQLLLRRDGAALARLDAAIDRRAAAAVQPRLDYLFARAADVGLVSLADLRTAFGDRAPASLSRYLQHGYEQAWQGSSAWYRMLAGLRLGRDPLPYDGFAPDAPATGPDTEPGPSDYARGLADWGLASRLRRELQPFYPVMQPQDFRVAASLAAQTQADEGIRIISVLLSRPGYQAELADAYLNWPRPFTEAMDAALAATGIDRSLMYGLVRSESLFMPAVVSRAGAVGLAQLMPATAEEMVGRLRLDSHDSTDPADNLLVGAAYLKRLLDAYDGAVLPALFAYNAGPGRYRSWRQAAGNLPADLMLETLSFAETRQYGRNVGVAAVHYAVLYENREALGYLRYVLQETD